MNHSNEIVRLHSLIITLEAQGCWMMAESMRAMLKRILERK